MHAIGRSGKLSSPPNARLVAPSTTALRQFRLFLPFKIEDAELDNGEAADPERGVVSTDHAVGVILGNAFVCHAVAQVEFHIEREQQEKPVLRNCVPRRRPP